MFHHQSISKDIHPEQRLLTGGLHQIVIIGLCLAVIFAGFPGCGQSDQKDIRGLLVPDTYRMHIGDKNDKDKAMTLDPR